MLGLKKITAIILGFSSCLSAAAISLEAFNLTDTAKSFLETRAPHAVPGPPHFVVYSDKFVSGVQGAPPVSQIKGFNVFALSFYLAAKGPFDKALEWQQLSAAQRQSIKAQYAAAGVKIVVSCFGGTETPTTSGVNPTTIANSVANYVKQFSLDGVDVDYEDLQAMNKGDGKAEQWLADFTKQLRSQLPQSTYILTHAPLAPWFSPGKFGGGGYLKVHQTVGSMIDWYNIQFYNQGVNEYTTCNGLLTQSSSVWPKSSVFEIQASGVPLSKLVIGKPATAADANNGLVATGTLAQCVQQAKGRGWNAGVMAWQFPNAGADWIKAVRGSAFPV